MISCLSLGPMVTRKIWHAGPIYNDWPQEECQVVSSSTTNASLSLVLWQGESLTHKLLLIKSPVYKWISPPSRSHPPHREMKSLVQSQKTHVFKIPQYRVEGLPGCLGGGWGRVGINGLVTSKALSRWVKAKSHLCSGQKSSLENIPWVSQGHTGVTHVFLKSEV